MPHAFAGALQKAGRVVELHSVEEADIHMSTEGVDVAKCRISHACSGMAVVQKFANVRSAGAHLLKPRLADPSQLVIGLGKPRVDARVSPNGTREPEELTRQIQPPLSRCRSYAYNVPAYYLEVALSTFVIVVMKHTRDEKELKEYRRIGIPSLQSTNVKFRVRPGPVEVLEGEPVEAVVVLEFPTREEAKEWYNSPVYQEALTHRRKGAECHAFMVDGN